MDYKVWMRASLIAITGGGGGVALSAEIETKRACTGGGVTGCKKKMKKDTGQMFMGWTFVGKTGR